MANFLLGGLKKVACRPFCEVELLQLASAGWYFGSLLASGSCEEFWTGWTRHRGGERGFGAPESGQGIAHGVIACRAHTSTCLAALVFYRVMRSRRARVPVVVAGAKGAGSTEHPLM